MNSKSINSNLVIIIILFTIGFIFCMNYKTSDIVENFQGINECPDLLIKKGKELHLVNTKKAMIPGVNPIRFNNLEEYAEYVKWSQKVGIKCPILYFEQTYDTQNNRGFRMLNDPLNPQPGLSSDPYYRKADYQKLTDSGRDDPPYNENNFSGFDSTDQYVGVKTPLDNVQLETNEGSLNPIDTDWCGHKCTQKALDAGRFEGRTRKILNPIDDKLKNSPRTN